MKRRYTHLTTLLVILLLGYVSPESEPNGTETVEAIANSTSFESANHTVPTSGTSAEATHELMMDTFGPDTEPPSAESMNVTVGPRNTSGTAVREEQFLIGAREAQAEVQEEESGEAGEPDGTELPAEMEAAGICLLKQAGDHPWLIRITPMMNLPTIPNERKRRRTRKKSRKPGFIPFIRFRRCVDNLKTKVDDNSPTAVETGNRGKLKHRARQATSKMHGSLITPSKVLTTVTYANVWRVHIPFPRNYLSLIGYNSEANCKQEQWGKEPHFHSKSSQGVINVGEFALIETYAHFKVEGEPFLFGPAGLPNFDLIAETYNDLASGYAQGSDERVTVYLFQDSKNRDDGKTYDSATFQFIPWEKCKELEQVKMIEGISSLEDEQDTFFCGNGNNEWSNEIENVTREDPLVGHDWFQGAPVIYKTEDNVVPMGHYAYIIKNRANGDPRVYATFTDNLFELLKQPVTEEGAYYTEETEPMNLDRVITGTITRTGKELPRAATLPVNIHQSGGLQCHTAELRMAVLGAFASVFAY